jgi:probable F420-dependent oxidoreductase
LKLNFGIRLPVTGPFASAENIIKVGVKADDLGFNAITTHDHVALTYAQRYHNSGGSAENVDERHSKGLPVTDVFETMETLAVLAGKTARVRLIPCSLVLPWRHPVLLAKQAITLQEMSGGRFVCSVVTGNMENEFNAMNVSFNDRGKLMDEYLEVLKLIFSSERVEFKGRFLNVSASEIYPRPSERIPIWIGGSFVMNAFRRVAKFADGFLPVGHLESFGTGIPRLEEYLGKQGRKLSEIEVGTQTFMCLMKDDDEAVKRSKYAIESFFHGPEYDRPDPNNPVRTRRQALMEGIRSSSLVGAPNQVIKRIEDFAALGVRFFDIRLVNTTPKAILEMMDLFAAEVMPSFA